MQMATTFNLTKSVILAVLPCGNICVRTKFDEKFENASIGGREKVKKSESNMAAANLALVTVVRGVVYRPYRTFKMLQHVWSLEAGNMSVVCLG